MKTIKCKITNEIDVSDYIRKYNSVLHIAFNAFKGGLSQPEIKKIINLKFKGLNSFIIQNAIIQAQGMFKSFDARSKDFELKNPNKKFKSLIFGGRNNLNILYQEMAIIFSGCHELVETFKEKNVNNL